MLVLQQQYSGVSNQEISQMLNDWSTKTYNGKYFEMFAITSDDTIVGNVSLFQHTPHIISCGPEIYRDYRRKGYAFEAMSIALDYAAKNGYKIAVAQIRNNNTASIALHAKLQFEFDHEYINNKGNSVLFYIKAIC